MRIITQPVGFFILCSILFGVVIIYLVPPMQAADENLHFLRVYQLADHQLKPSKVKIEANNRSFISVGGVFPDNVASFTNDFLYKIRESKNSTKIIKRDVVDEAFTKYKNSRVDYANTNTQVALPNTGAYSPVVYAPQLFAIAFGKATNMKIIHFYYLGRILGLITWVAIVAFALWLLPVGKWLAVVISLLPVSLFQATTFSADSLTSALVLLVLAIFIYFLDKSRPINIRSVILITVTTSILALCKPGFWPIALLFWFLPLSIFRNKFVYILSNLLITLSALISFLIWYKQIQFTIPYLAVTFLPGKLISFQQQFEYILTNPFNLLILLIHQLFSKNMFFTFFDSLGAMGWREIFMPWLSSLMILATLIYGILITSIERIKNYNTTQRLGSILITSLLFSLILLSLYTSFTPLYKNSIDGIQGRYFIVLYYMFIPIFGGVAIKYKAKLTIIKNKELLIIPLVLVSLITTIATIYERFYA